MHRVSRIKDEQIVKTVSYRFVSDTLSYIKEHKKSQGEFLLKKVLLGAKEPRTADLPVQIIFIFFESTHIESGLVLGEIHLVKELTPLCSNATGGLNRSK